MDTMAFQIRWRYLSAAFVLLAVVCGIVFGIHELQMPKIAERVLSESRTLAAAGETSQARARYSDYLSLNPGNSDAYEEYANLVLASADTTSSVRSDATALKLLDAAVQNGATSHQTKVRLVQAAMRLSKYSMAQRMLRRMDLVSLKNADLYAADGICDLNHGRADRAEKAFRKALEIDNKCIEAWTGLLEIEADMNQDFAAAEITADRMIAALPAEGQSAKAWLYIRMEDFSSAGKAFFAAAKMLPGEQEHAFNLANFVMRSGVAPVGDNQVVVEFASDNLKSAFDKNVSYEVAFLMGDIAQRLGRLQESEAHYRKCLEQRPADSAAIGRIVEVLSEADDFESAAKSLESLPKTKGLIALKAVLKARLLAEQQKFDEASDTLEEIVEIASADMKQAAHVLLMDCLCRQQRFAEATKYGFKLLTITENDDESRRLLVEAMINDGRYAEAINQIQLVFSPEQYYDPMLTYLTEHARRNNLQDKLRTEMQVAAKFSRSASLPRIFEACELVEGNDFATAQKLLIRNAMDSPEANEYWSQLNLLRNRIIEQRSSLNLQDGLQGLDSDEARCMYCVGAIQRHENDRVLSLLIDHIAANSGSNESLQLVAEVIQAVAKHDAVAARQLLDATYPEFYKRLREPSGVMTELTASLLFQFGEHERLAALEEYLVVNESTVRLTSVMSDLIARGKVNGAKLGSSLGAKNEPSEAVRRSLTKIFETEVSVTDTDTELSGLVDQLAEYVKEEGISQPVVSSLLRLAGYDESIRPGLAEMGFWLKKQRPDDDYALHLLSCGLRASRRYPESLAFSQQAFELNQDPLYLLHASYTLWLLHRSEQSRDTLELAFKAGMQSDRLHLLDQKLLARLLNDPDFQDVGLAAR